MARHQANTYVVYNFYIILFENTEIAMYTVLACDYIDDDFN